MRPFIVMRVSDRGSTMPDAAAVQASNTQFMDYLRTRMFGLVAFVDRPGSDELFPMASGVIIESEGQYVLLTAAHFLRDVNRWKDQKRLNALLLIVHHESGLCNLISLDLDKNFRSFSEDFDFGFVLLNPDVVAEIARRGGLLTRRDNLAEWSGELTNSFVVGHASAYCKLRREVIATQDQGPERVEWSISRPGDLAVVMSRLLFAGNGADRGTYRFALVNGYDDYRGTSGGPIFGYTQGALVRDYVLVAIQSKQIRSATGEQKPTHLIATSAALAVHLVDDRIRKMKESVE
jgi:hypothetical protein